MKQYHPVGCLQEDLIMSDIFKLAEELYDDHRSNYGDGEYAWEEAKEEAREIIQRQNAHEERQRDLWESSSPKRRK